MTQSRGVAVIGAGFKAAHARGAHTETLAGLPVAQPRRNDAQNPAAQIR